MIDGRIETGTKVKHILGGPVMAVRTDSEDGSIVHCEWFTQGKGLCREIFRRESLVPYTPRKREGAKG